MATQGYEDFWYSSTDGLKLHARIYGEPNRRLPVVCLPGHADGATSQALEWAMLEAALGDFGGRDPHARLASSMDYAWMI